MFMVNRRKYFECGFDLPKICRVNLSRKTLDIDLRHLCYLTYFVCLCLINQNVLSSKHGQKGKPNLRAIKQPRLLTASYLEVWEDKEDISSQAVHTQEHSTIKKPQHC